MRMSDWISDLCSSDLRYPPAPVQAADLAGQPAELLRIAHDVDVAEAAVAFVTEGHRRADGIPLVEHQAEGAVDLLPHLTPARPGAAEHLRDAAHDLRGPAQHAYRPPHLAAAVGPHRDRKSGVAGRGVAVRV